MSLAEFTIPFSRFWPFEEPWRRPVAIINLKDETSTINEVGRLSAKMPACPVIGIGSKDHPLGPMMDAVLEGPFNAAALVQSITANPHAAAVLVQVLRLTEHSPPQDALTMESMAYAVLQGSAEHRSWLAARQPHVISPPGHLGVKRVAATLEVELDRPWAGNAIDRSMRDALLQALSLAAVDEEIDQIILRAGGKAFSLGADLAEFGTTTDPATAHSIRGLTLPAHGAIACAERLEVQIDGACVGAGLELAAFAKRITATSRSWFQLPELAMGIIPGAGGCVSVPRRIGRQRAALLVLSGRRINARTALQWGLIDAIVDELSADDRCSNVPVDSA